MKNVILTHNEIQVNLFNAVTYGLQTLSLGEGLFIKSSIKDEDYMWTVVRHHYVEGCAVEGHPLYYHYISKGDYQMNDLRLGVTVSFIREQAEKFIIGFRKYMETEDSKMNTKSVTSNVTRS